MAKLTIVGLGPGGAAYLTMQAVDTLLGAEIAYLRTEKHPVVSYLVEKGARFEYFDGFYETYETFDEVYENIAGTVLEKLNGSDVVYAVPGNPFVAERTVEILIESLSESKGHEYEVVYGASFIDAIITTLKMDPVHGLKIVDGLQLSKYVPDTTVDNMFIQVYDKTVASDVKLELMKYYNDDHEITVVRGAGIPGEEKIQTVPLYELDRLDILDYLTSVYIPRVDEKEKYFFWDLNDIMEQLRGIDGCPWDREQTHESLKQYLIEEAYEVIEAIDKDDLYALEEELGDLLLQVVFHSAIAAENGYFDINDVTTGISKKLINRHPHVFSDVDVADSDEVLTNWEAIKKEEKQITSYGECMDKVPNHLPGLMRAYKIQKKAAEVGFEWDNVTDVIGKIMEEIEEVKVEIESRDEEKLESELGDLLFSIVNLCRYFKINPEIALSKTSEKFIKRFKFVEESIEAEGGNLKGATLEKMDFYWEKSKKR